MARSLMKQVIVFFVMKGCQQPSLQVVVSESEAIQMLKHWRDGNPARLGGYLKGEDLHWGVDPSEVSCMFTRDLEMLRQQAQRGQPSQPPQWWNMSGNN